MCLWNSVVLNVSSLEVTYAQQCHKSVALHFFITKNTYTVSWIYGHLYKMFQLLHILCKTKFMYMIVCSAILSPMSKAFQKCCGCTIHTSLLNIAVILMIKPSGFQICILIMVSSFWQEYQLFIQATKIKTKLIFTQHTSNLYI